MFPAWVTKLRDVKAGSKHRQEKKPVLSSSSSGKRRDEDPASFAKALSLQRANSRARNCRFEAEIDHGCRDVDPLPLTNDHTLSSIDAFAMENLRSYGDAELRKEAASLMIQRRDLDPWDRDFSSMSSCGSEPDPLSGKEIRVSAPSVQKCHGVSDNDTEDFALTPDTNSSFCSETSSADSAVSCKCGCEEEGNHQRQQLRQERSSQNVAGNPNFVCRKSQRSSSLCSSASKENPCLIPIKSQESISPDAAEKSGLPVSTTWQESISITAESPGLKSSTWLESSRLSFEENSSLMSSRWETRSRAAENPNLIAINPKQGGKISAENPSLISSNWQERSSSAGNRCSMPSRWQERSGSDGPKNPSLTWGGWHEKICPSAVENPSLISNKWQQRRSPKSVGNPSLSCSNWQERSSSSSIENSSFVSSKWQEKSSAGNTNGKHEASLRRRRRHSSSSISAVLPADLQGVVGDSIALVKMSDNPYEDFRQSMYEMIMEKDLEESMDVEELLYCYLTLNAPEHYELIEEVFSEVWSAILMTLR